MGMLGEMPTRFATLFLAILILSAASIEARAAVSAQQQPDGVIMFTADEPAAVRTWAYAATRWGMYWVDVHYAAAGPATITVKIGDASVTQQVQPLDEAVAQPATRLGKIYVSKAGPIELHAAGDGAVIRGVTLTPAPEGGPIRQAADGVITLHSRDATVHGVTLRYEPRPEKNTLGYWSNAGDYASWTFEVVQPGRFVIDVMQGCGKGHGGSEAAVVIGDGRLAFEVIDTGGWQNFVVRTIGSVHIAAPGLHTLKLQAVNKAGAAVMDCREIRLLPAN